MSFENFLKRSLKKNFSVGAVFSSTASGISLFLLKNLNFIEFPFAKRDNYINYIISNK